MFGRLRKQSWGEVLSRDIGVQDGDVRSLTMNTGDLQQAGVRWSKHGQEWGAGKCMFHPSRVNVVLPLLSPMDIRFFSL